MMELLLAQEGIRAAAVRTETWTRFQITFLDPDTWEWTTVLEPGVAITAAERDALHARYEELLPEAALVVLSGSSPCRVLDDSFRWMTEAAHRRDRRVILDTYGDSLRLALPAAPFMVKPNVVESEGLLGRSLPDEASRWEAVQHYHASGVRLVILSAGAEGALVSFEGRRWRVVPPPVETLNPVGSGDSLVGAVAVGLVRGLPIEDLIRLGIAAGAANAAVWEPASCTAGQVQALVAGVRLEPVG
jgi:tagatose 6-phosphate kinase